MLINFYLQVFMVKMYACKSWILLSYTKAHCLGKFWLRISDFSLVTMIILTVLLLSLPAIVS